MTGLTGDDISRSTGWHRSKVSRVELGQAEISVVDAIHYLGACKVFAAEAQELLDLCTEAERQARLLAKPARRVAGGLLNSLIYHEATAVRSVSYEPLLDPWPPADRGLCAGPDLPKRRLVAGRRSRRGFRMREERQQVLHRPRPGRFTFYVHEQALRLAVGSAAVMHEQLLQLVIVAAMPTCDLRIVPGVAGERALFGGSFRLFEFREHRPLVFLDGVAVGLFLEDPTSLPTIGSFSLGSTRWRWMRKNRGCS